MRKYPVTALFKPIQNAADMTLEEAKKIFAENSQECSIYLDYKNAILVILPKDVDAIEFQHNYLSYINLRLCNGETTSNGMFDAGYVPFIYMPVLYPSKSTPREFIQKMLTFVSRQKIRLYKMSCSLLPSDFKSDRNIQDYWIRRADLHRLWDLVWGIKEEKAYSDNDNFDILQALEDIYKKGVE